MTPEERAEKLVSDTEMQTDCGPNLFIYVAHQKIATADVEQGKRTAAAIREGITDAIRAAVKEEQEACARLVLETDVITSVIRTGEYPNGEEERENAYATLEAAARAIRARSNPPGT